LPHSRAIEGLGVEARLVFLLLMAWWANRRSEGSVPIGPEIDFRAPTSRPLTMPPAPA